MSVLDIPVFPFIANQHNDITTEQHS